jgi:hypothetical protein
MLARPIESSIALDIPFRGGRNFVHSTDLFAELDGLAGKFLAPRAHLKNLTLRRQAHRQIAAHFLPHPDAFGSFALALPHQTLEGWLVESPALITRRIAFDEVAISRAAVSEPGRVFLPGPVKGYSGFEQMIVLFKMLCAQSHPGAWLFTGIDLNRALGKEARLAVSRTQTVLNRLVDARLDQDGETVGRVRMVRAAGGNI